MQLFYPLGFPSEQDRSTANYDSVNSLTTYSNHYTLLYPDLVQALFNFSLHNNNSLVDNSPFLRNISLNNTKSSSLDSSISCSLVQELFNFSLHNSNSTLNNLLFISGLDVNRHRQVK